MNAIVITWPQLVVVVFLLLVVYGLEAFFMLRRRNAPPLAQDPDERLLEIERRLEQLEAMASTMAAAALEHPSPIDDQNSPYNLAIRLAKEGRDVSSIAFESGISRGEAELIVALYRSGAR